MIHARRRPRRDRPAADGGSATLEFVLVGVLLLVPLVYGLISVFAVQSAAYGVSAAAREAGRAFVQTTDGDPYARAYQAAAIALRDHGIELAPDDLTIQCGATPCLSPGASVTVAVAVEVPLPLAPKIFGEVPASIGVDGRHVAVVDRFRPAGSA